MKKCLNPDKKKEDVKEMLKLLRPLGFVGNGELSMTFTHTGLNRGYDFSAIAPQKACDYAIMSVFKSGVDCGIESIRREIRVVLGLE